MTAERRVCVDFEVDFTNGGGIRLDIEAAESSTVHGPLAVGARTARDATWRRFSIARNARSYVYVKRLSQIA